MASLENAIRVYKELRPCMADGKRAMFHKWVTVREIVPPSIMKGGHLGGEVQDDFALVEYVDGTVAKVDVGSVRFLDSEDRPAEEE